MREKMCGCTFCNDYDPDDKVNHCREWHDISDCRLGAAFSLGKVALSPIVSQPTAATETEIRSIFQTVATEIGELVTEKNRAYGNSFAKCGEFLRLLYPSGIAPEAYDDALAMVRIFDKQMRIATQKDALGESPYRDIAGYGILGAAKDQGKGE